METKTLTTKDNIVKILTDLMDNECKVVPNEKKLRLNFTDKDEIMCYSVRIESLRLQPLEFRQRIFDLYGYMIGKF